MRTDEDLLRELLWLRHGCPHEALYGDDGEMQCSVCKIDFKRDAPQQMADHWIKESIQHVVDEATKNKDN